jgi:hypothetical protein
VIVFKPLNLLEYHAHFFAASLNGGRLSPLMLPAANVMPHLIVTAKLPLYVAAHCTNCRLFFGLIDQHEATSLAYAVFPVALLTETTPSPITTFPEDLVIVTHTYNVQDGDRDSEPEGLVS